MKIGILGATGAVGQQMIQCLQEEHISVEELRVFASAKSVGKKIVFQNKEWTVQEISKEGLQGLDVLFGAVSASLAREYKSMILESGAIFIDNSSAFRLQDDVPLVVPEINGPDAFQHHGIIGNPNCSTIITLMACAPLMKLSPITKMIASTYQAVSGAGKQGMDELQEEVEALRTNKEYTPTVFPTQIAYNCIPWIGSLQPSGFTTEEEKMQNEGRKILHLPELKVSCTCVRVPVMRCHSISFSVQCERPIEIEEAALSISQFPGDVYVSEGFPTPLEVANQNKVFVGRLRKDPVLEGGLSVWCCGDQIRKGAASNAVGILKTLIEK